MKITWFGHSAFRIAFGDTVILIDPFLSGNPKFDGDAMEAAAGCTHVLLTHGHDDHVGDALEILNATGAQLVGAFEVCMSLVALGVGEDKINPGNHGGTVDCGGFSTSFVNALHSSSLSAGHPAVKDGGIAFLYMGNPLGLIVKAPGEPVLYHMGDTDIFGDMALINEIHRLRSASCRSATASPWGPRPRPWPASVSLISEPFFPAITARFRSSTRAPMPSCRKWAMTPAR